MGNLRGKNPTKPTKKPQEIWIRPAIPWVEMWHVFFFCLLDFHDSWTVCFRCWALPRLCKKGRGPSNKNPKENEHQPLINGAAWRSRTTFLTEDRWWCRRDLAAIGWGWKKYVHIPSEKYIYIDMCIWKYMCKYVYIHTYVKWMSTCIMLSCHKNGWVPVLCCLVIKMDEYRSYAGLVIKMDEYRSYAGLS